MGMDFQPSRPCKIDQASAELFEFAFAPLKLEDLSQK